MSEILIAYLALLAGVVIGGFFMGVFMWIWSFTEKDPRP